MFQTLGEHHHFCHIVQILYTFTFFSWMSIFQIYNLIFHLLKADLDVSVWFLWVQGHSLRGRGFALTRAHWRNKRVNGVIKQNCDSRGQVWYSFQIQIKARKKQVSEHVFYHFSRHYLLRLAVKSWVFWSFFIFLLVFIAVAAIQCYLIYSRGSIWEITRDRWNLQSSFFILYIYYSINIITFWSFVWPFNTWPLGAKTDLIMEVHLVLCIWKGSISSQRMSARHRLKCD